LDTDDIIVTNHRCHGHFLAYGGDPRALFAEMMGRATGVCGGRGGSQHIHWRNLYSNGVQGGIVPIAAGMAMAEKQKNSGAVVTVFIGDGTFGEGVIYEAFNMARLWELPLLIVVEHNHIAQTTPTELALAGSLAERLNALGIAVSELDTSDVLVIREEAQRSISHIRQYTLPAALILNTVRFGPHSKGDDTRDENKMGLLKEKRDPLRILGERLPSEKVQQVQSQVDLEVSQAFSQALADPEAGLQGGLDG
jgi:TPP-dependent pyruvate/acetoin dehydrogenase alpha subunit